MLPWHDAATWRRLLDGEDCPLCQPPRAEELVAEWPLSRLVAPCRPCVAGHCCLVLRKHVAEWHDLPVDEAAAYALELRRATAAVGHVTSAVKINLAIFGNVVPHLHVHIVPRRPGDRFDGRPLDPGDTSPDLYASGEHERLIMRLREALSNLG